MPKLTAQARAQPLPDGVLEVIRIAAGCSESLDEAVKLSKENPAFVKAAAELYVQQVLLFPSADSYRVLGVRAGATHEEMRTHMRWLMTWVHPDRAKENWESAFASRVLAAWREVGRAQAPKAAAAAPRRIERAPAPLGFRRMRRPQQAQRRRSLWKLLPAALLIVVILSLLEPGGWLWTDMLKTAQAALSLGALSSVGDDGAEP